MFLSVFPEVSLRKLLNTLPLRTTYNGAVPSKGAELFAIDHSGIDFPLHAKVHYDVKKDNTLYTNGTLLKLFQSHLF